MSIMLTQYDEIAVVDLSHPPVNAFGIGLRRSLTNTFTSIAADDSVSAVVVRGAGSGFSAGGDRTEFGKPEASERPTLSRDVLAALQACGKPVVAAIHGFAIGGGLEFALACHARVATRAARIGLPEIGLGRFPLSGSQRLPRLLGLALAADWIMDGRILEAHDATAEPIFDRLVDSNDMLLPSALEVARAAIDSMPKLIDHRALPDADPQEVFKQIETKYPSATLSAAQTALLEALRAASSAPDFDSGLARAQELFDELTGQT